MTLVPSSKNFRDKMPNTIEKRTYNKYKRRQLSQFAHNQSPDKEPLLKMDSLIEETGESIKLSLNMSYVDRNAYERLPTATPFDNALKPLYNDISNKKLKEVDTSYVDRLYK